MSWKCDICGSEAVYSYSDLRLVEAPPVYTRSYYCQKCHERIFLKILEMKQEAKV